MAHVGIFGPTMCGKTTLGQHLAKSYEAAGIRCLVCDPMGNRWPASWQTGDMAAFLAKAKASQRCALLIDEAGLTIDRDRTLQWLFVTARQWGHRTHVFGHDGSQLLPVMRQQISELFLFACHPDVAEMWGRQFPKSANELRSAPELGRFEFLCVRQFQPARRCKLRL